MNQTKSARICVGQNVRDVESIKDNMSGYPFIERLYVRAIEAACEAIQVAAMAQKFIDSQKVREKSEQL